MKILIVEDESDSRIFLERRLQKEGYTVFSAVNGLEALEILREPKTDLVISDIMMPEMDGFELCRRMKADKQLRTIPFLFYTATFLDRKDEKLAMALGGERFIVKPMDIERLLEIIAEVLEKHQGEMIPSPGKPLKSEEELTSMYAESISGKLQKKVIELEAEHEALVRSEQKYRCLFEFSRDGICIISEQKEILDFNRQFRKFTQRTEDELLSMKLEDIFPSTSAELTEGRIKKMLQGEDVDLFEAVLYAGNGEKMPVEINVTKLENCYDRDFVFQGSIRDITDRKQIEKEREELEFQLRQSQKMEAIGTLAGGIAHDFNNILSAVFGYLELLQDHVEGDKNAGHMLEQVQNAADRAANLVKQILLFSRQTGQKTGPVQPHLVVKEALKLLRASIPSTIEIKSDVPTDCGRILADPTQFHQIVMNLSTNSYHAMRGKGGILGVSLRALEITEDDISFGNLDIDMGSYVRLEISDTGHGMDLATMEKMFNPYFTTKPKGEGTGLGLSVVHGIVKNIGGRIKVYSEKGKGTSIQVYFPRIDVEESDATERQVDIIPTGHERILVVDDEPPILKLNKIMLERLGYRVTCFENPRDALKTFSENPDQFDLVLTDLTMPDLTGLELTERIFRIKPDIPVILCTGFSELISQEQAEALNIKGLLTKPVHRIDLARALRRILD